MGLRTLGALLTAGALTLLSGDVDALQPPAAPSLMDVMWWLFVDEQQHGMYPDGGVVPLPKVADRWRCRYGAIEKQRKPGKPTVEMRRLYCSRGDAVVHISAECKQVDSQELKPAAIADLTLNETGPDGIPKPVAVVGLLCMPRVVAN